jgi:cytoskeletal protein CcmA (bactofilin family)
VFGRSDSARAEPPAADRDRDRGPAVSPAAGTLVGSSARFVGEITGDEDISVQGRVEGNIHVTRRVTVAPSGEIEGDVHARSVVVAGKVKGLIRADERAELLASAVVQGDVRAPKVVIAEGAQLQGSVAMSDASGTGSGSQAAPPPPPAAPVES